MVTHALTYLNKGDRIINIYSILSLLVHFNTAKTNSSANQRTNSAEKLEVFLLTALTWWFTYHHGKAALWRFRI